MIYRILFIIALLLAAVENSTGQMPVQESVRIQTDRDIYIAGENVFFKCYNLDIRTQKLSTLSNFAYLVLRNDRNSRIIGICMKLENGMFSGSITLPDTLSTGHYQIVSYTNYMRNAGEQTFFSKEILVTNRFDNELSKIFDSNNIGNHPIEDSVHNSKVVSKEIINLSTDKKNYGKRKKITIKLEGTEIPDAEMANLSISVHENLPGAANEFEESRAPIADPVNKLTCRYLPEVGGVLMSGKVKDVANGNGLSKQLIYLSVPDSVSNLQFAYTDNSGNFMFQLNDYYYDKNLILNLPNTDKAYFEFDDKFALEKTFKPSRHFPESSLRDFVCKSQKIVEVHKNLPEDTYTEIAYKPQSPVNVPLAYPPGANTVYPADFTSLPDFVEITREILPLLSISKHKGTYEAKMTDAASMQFLDSDPLIFLDGVPVENINSIINLGSEKIRKIESVASERCFGDLYFSGILSIFTKKMEINNVSRSTPTLSSRYVVYHPASLLKTLNPPTNRREPDFRQILFWEPTLTMKGGETKLIELTTSDNKGEYVIVVEGFTNSGRYIRTCSTFRVTNSFN